MYERMIWAGAATIALPERTYWVYTGASGCRMQEGDPSFSTHEIKNDWPCPWLLGHETSIEISDECACVEFLAQFAHHLLGDLNLYIFSGVFLNSIRLQILFQ